MSSTLQIDMSSSSVDRVKVQRSNSKLRRNLYIVVAFLLIFLVATIVLAILYVKKDSDSDSNSNSDKNIASTITPAPTITTTSILPTDGDATNFTTQGPYAHGAVAADDKRCSNVGARILQKNGSAVDAAVATVFCVGVINLHSTGIGGGGVMVVYSKKKGKAEYYNFREKAPGNATEKMYVNKTGTPSKLGGLAIAVPGEIKGMYEAHKNYGVLEWEELVQPSIDYAKNGFIIHEALDIAIKQEKDTILKSEGLRELFEKDDGKLKEKGERLVNEKLAHTLTRIRDDPMSFYNGSLAENIFHDISAEGGIITLNDLKNYSIEIKQAINESIGNRRLFTTDLPSSGIIITFMLNVLKGYNFTSEDVMTDDGKAKTFHKIIETFKYAYARRALLGDSDYENVTAIYNELLDSNYAESIRVNISNNHTFHNPRHYGGYYSNYDAPGTSHVSILAPNGDAVSVTITINTYFGSKVRSPVTGIIYNNQMDDFSTPGLPNFFGIHPSPANFIKPGKRPLSSMSPVIFTNKTSGDVEFVAGASGGTRITTGTALVSMQKLWFGLNTSEAVVTPRFHHQLLPNYTTIEQNSRYRLSNNIVQLLRNYNHNFQNGTKCVVQAVSREPNGEIYAKSDPRKGGFPAGF